MNGNRLATLAMVIALTAPYAVLGSDAPLADAAENQDAAGVRKLLEQRVGVNQAQVDGMTALHWATYHDDAALARVLVEAGANVNAANRYGVTPLPIACTNGSDAIVDLLLKAGADPNTTQRGGETVLMTASRTGKLGPVKALLARGAKVDAKEQKGQTALMWAAAEGHSDVVQTLIAAGADFRIALPSGFTPLLFAVREGRTAVVQTLLKAGADVNEATQPQRKPSGRAPEAGMTPLIMAVENGHFELAALLLKAGADPNDQRSGYAALHTITWVRKPHRGDGIEGDPAPQGSGEMTSLELVKELAARGADVNLRLKQNSPGRGAIGKKDATPFLLAAVRADAPLMRTLLDLGADPHLPNADNCTPLLAAAGVGTRAPGEEAGTEPEVLESLQLLMQLGADVNAVDDDGETAMHGAAYKSLPKVVQFLADKGAKIEIWNRKNKKGWTPLLIAHGYRPGNFKPSAETIAAIRQVMLAQGVTPPENPRPDRQKANY